MAVRWDSPFVLAAAGTLAFHLALVTVSDAVVVTHPPRPYVAPPHLELVDIEVPPVLKPPPPPLPAAAPVPAAPAPPVPPVPRARAVRSVPTPVRAPEPAPAPAPTPAAAPTGGEQVVSMDDIAPSATGVGVAVGRPATGRIGRGGSGGGTGAGSGSGSEDEVKPMSIAGIGTDAVVKGDHRYINLGKDYPAEARDRGIEGKILVRLVIDEHGKVTSRLLVTRLGHGLDELALQYAAKLEFEPAKDTNGKPVASQLTWTFDMVPPK